MCRRYTDTPTSPTRLVWSDCCALHIRGRGELTHIKTHVEHLTDTSARSDAQVTGAKADEVAYISVTNVYAFWCAGCT